MGENRPTHQFIDSIPDELRMPHNYDELQSESVKSLDGLLITRRAFSDWLSANHPGCSLDINDGILAPIGTTVPEGGFYSRFRKSTFDKNWQDIITEYQMYGSYDWVKNYRKF